MQQIIRDYHLRWPQFRKEAKVGEGELFGSDFVLFQGLSKNKGRSRPQGENLGCVKVCLWHMTSLFRDVVGYMSLYRELRSIP